MRFISKRLRDLTVAMLLAAGAGIATAPAAAHDLPIAPSSSAAQPAPLDIEVAAGVRNVLMGDASMDGIQLIVRVANGTVEMLGVAVDAAQAERAVALALQVPGVSEVIHYIEIDPVQPAGVPVRYTL